jgi:hypothetical protein
LIGHTLCSNRLLKHFIEGRIEEGVVLKGRRRKEELNDLKEMRRYCKLKEETLNGTLWRTRCGRDYGPVIRSLRNV